MERNTKQLVEQGLITLVLLVAGVIMYFVVGSVVDHWRWYALLLALWLTGILIHQISFHRKSLAVNQQRQALLHTVTNAAPVMIWTVDAREVVVDIFGRALENAAFKREDAVGRNIVFFDQEENDFYGHLRRALNGDRFVAFGNVGGRFYRHHFFPSGERKLNSQGFQCVSVDLTREAELDAQLKLSEQVFNNTTDAIMVMDHGRRVVKLNKAFTTITGFEERELLGKRNGPSWFNAQKLGFYKSIYNALNTVGAWRGEISAKRKSGEPFTGHLTLSLIRDETKEVSHYVAFFSDTSDLKRSQDELRYLANHDNLTNLPNRRLFLDRLEHAIKVSARTNSKLAIFFIDLDNFKLVNDSHGHAFGDEVLKEVGVRLKAAMRGSDTVARLAGDEFTVIAERVRDTIEVTAVARKLLQCFERPFEALGQTLHVSASVGIGIFPDDGENLVSLMKNADQAMYKAKAEGRNGFYYLSGEGVGNLPGGLFFPSELRLALKREQIEMAYQPIIDLKSGRVIGCEALLRWNHHCRGKVSPADFMPLAEEAGITEAIGQWTLDEACGQINEWRHLGIDMDFVSVNIASSQITDPHFLEMVAEAISKNDLDPTSLMLEVSENVALRHLERTTTFLQQARKLGMRCAIDDFGSSGNNYSYIRDLPIDTLKISRKASLTIANGPEQTRLLKALIGIGEVLGINVVAVGVERSQQEEVLRELGCGAAQGFLYAKPMSAESITDVLPDMDVRVIKNAS